MDTQHSVLLFFDAPKQVANPMFAYGKTMLRYAKVMADFIDAVMEQKNSVDGAASRGLFQKIKSAHSPENTVAAEIASMVMN